MLVNEKNLIPHTPAVLKQIFKKWGITPNKRFGQNFLIDQNILFYIPRSANLQEDDVVLEIGTGTGGLTRLLAEKAGHVFTVEVDKKLYELSYAMLKYYENVTTINADILKTKHELNPEVTSRIYDWLKEHKQSSLKIVSNLPYNISTPIIINLLQSDLPIVLMSLMLQKDITERLAAQPGTKAYGKLSVITQLFADIEVIKILPPQVFWPKPEVYSAIVKITAHKNKYADSIDDYPFFIKIISSIFRTRRKTLFNSLDNFKSPKVTKDRIKAVLKKMGLDERIRGEVLNIEQLIRFSEEIGR